MNVLHLCTKVPFPAKDGGALAIMSFARLLRMEGHTVTILAANTSKHFQVDVPSETEGISVYAVKVPAPVSLPGIIYNLLFSKAPYNVTRFRDNDFAEELIGLISKNNYDIIQLEGSHMGIYLPEIRKFSNAKVVLRAHNIEHLLWENIKNETSSLFKRYYLSILTARLRNFEIELMSDVDAVVAISESDLKTILKFAKPLQCVAIPFGIDLARYPQPEEGKENSLFFIGALDWIPNQKGLIWFLDNVWPKLRNDCSEVHLHVAGRNAPAWIVDRLKKQKITFYGEIANATKFLSEFQIQIVPLFSGSGIRIKILEGMAMGKAIVATSKAAEGIEITPGKELMIADEVESFVQKIKDLLTDKHKRISIGTEARAFISKEFDNLALANKVGSFYRKLIPV